MNRLYINLHSSEYQPNDELNQRSWHNRWKWNIINVIGKAKTHVKSNEVSTLNVDPFVKIHSDGSKTNVDADTFMKFKVHWLENTSDYFRVSFCLTLLCIQTLKIIKWPMDHFFQSIF